MTRILVIAAALVLASSQAFAANLATPTATAAAATPDATPAEKPALTLRASARGTCTFDLPSIAAAPTPAPSSALTPIITKITCPAPGAQVNDLVLVGGFMPYDTGGTTPYSALTLRSCVVRTQGVLDCVLAYGANSALDPGPLSFGFVAIP